MEANVVLQTSVPAANMNRVRPTNNNGGATNNGASAAANINRVYASPARAVPPARPAAPAPRMIDGTTAIAPSADILNAHSAVSAHRTEDLVEFSMPILENEVTEASISRVIDAANEALRPSFFRLDFNIHEATNLVMVQVIDTNSEEVLREVPPESRLDIIARIQESAGLLFDAQS
jgi:flagellar protein FlaG